MEFTAQELMFLFDAAVHMSIRPDMEDNAFVQQITEDVGDKIEKQLAAHGYHFQEAVVYVVDAH